MKKLSTFFKTKYLVVTMIMGIELVAILGLTVYQYFKYLPAPDINVNTTITFYDSDGEVFLEKHTLKIKTGLHSMKFLLT